MKNILLLIIVVLIAFSCSDDSRVIEGDSTRALLVATKAPNPTLKLVYFKTGEVTNNNIEIDTLDGSTIDAEITKIAEFRDVLYLLQANAFKITIIDKATFQKIAVIDYSDEQGMPTDICFPNATSAAVIFSNKDKVSFIDILFNLRDLDVDLQPGSNPVDIACIGNKIYTANQGSNSVSVIASNTHTIIDTIPVNTAPTFLSVVNVSDRPTDPRAPDILGLLITSLGDGKINGNTKTAATVQLLDTTNFTLNPAGEAELGIRNSEAIDQTPQSAFGTPQGMVFISTKDIIFQYIVRKSQIFPISLNQSFLYSRYITSREEGVLLDASNNLTIADPLTGTFSEKIRLSNFNISTIHPM